MPGQLNVPDSHSSGHTHHSLSPRIRALEPIDGNLYHVSLKCVHPSRGAGMPSIIYLCIYLWYLSFICLFICLFMSPVRLSIIRSVCFKTVTQHKVFLFVAQICDCQRATLSFFCFYFRFASGRVLAWWDTTESPWPSWISFRRNEQVRQGFEPKIPSIVITPPPCIVRSSVSTIQCEDATCWSRVSAWWINL